MRWMMLAALLCCAPALAASPPKDTPDWQRMQPFSFWIASQNNADGYWCCSLADGRPVDADIRRGRDGNEHWFAHITPEHFPQLPDEWIEIPDDLVIRSHTAGAPRFAIVWMNVSTNSPYCFWPGIEV